MSKKERIKELEDKVFLLEHAYDVLKQDYKYLFNQQQYILQEIERVKINSELKEVKLRPGVRCNG